MEQNKSPFEEIFKREEGRKKKEEKEEGILAALDQEEKSLFEESSDSKPISLEGEEGKDSSGGSKEDRCRKLLNSLVEKRFFEEAMVLLGEMKEEFGK